MSSANTKSPAPAALVLIAAIAAIVACAPTTAKAAADLQVTFTAPTSIEATAGSPMTLKLKVKNVGTEASAAVRLSLYKYDHTCSGYPLTQPTPSYLDVGSLAAGAERLEELSFTDANTSVPSGAASLTVCYTTGLKTSTGGYYSDSNNANHKSSKAVKYVASATTTTAPLAFTISNLRVSPTSCGPGQHWVEAIVNSTQPALASVTLETGGATAAATTPVTLQAGNNTVRANLTYPQSGTYTISFAVAKGDLRASSSLTANIPKCKGTITITAPAPGEVVPAGGSYTVRWTSSNVPKDDLLNISVWNGSQYVSVATSTPNDNSETVTMPNVSITNAKVQMAATKVIAPAFTRDFTLNSGPASITITQPAGGESIAAGSTACLRWTSSGNTGNAVSISLYQGDQFFRRLATSVPNDGNECVTIPSDAPAMSNARLEIWTSTEIRVKSNAFTITNGTNATGFTVSAPAAGARLAAGSNTTVTWTSSGNPGSNVTLKLSLNNGSYADIPGKVNIANDGSEEITLPAVYSWSGCTASPCPQAGSTAANAAGLVSTTQAKIRVVSTTNTAQGESGSFSITVPALRFGSTPGNFYAMIVDRCSACHPNAGDGMINPQRARAADDPASSVNETVAPVIPFNNTISATEMLNRFKQVKAVSDNYARARDKKYVVANDPSQSGLHWKAQDSGSSIFEEDLTIEGVKLKIQDWISLWIKQGAQ